MKISKFADEVNSFLQEERIAKDDIQIWGGKRKENELRAFISNWDQSEMPFVILETIREIVIRKNYAFSTLEPHAVERIRIFGACGDLDIRRDADHFRWRYVGEKKLPEEVTGEYFWDKHADRKFFVEEKEALLWGVYNANRKVWHDNRVAKAKLSYPVDGNPKRVKIRYRTLSEGGVIAFVWFVELKGGEDDDQ